MDIVLTLVGIALMLCFLCLFFLGCIVMVLVFEICKHRGRKMEQKQEEERNRAEMQKEKEWINLLSYNGSVQGGEMID